MCKNMLIIVDSRYGSHQGKLLKWKNINMEITFYFQQLVGAEYALQQCHLQLQLDSLEEDDLSS